MHKQFCRNLFNLTAVSSSSDKARPVIRPSLLYLPSSEPSRCVRYFFPRFVSKKLARLNDCKMRILIAGCPATCIKHNLVVTLQSIAGNIASCHATLKKFNLVFYIGSTWKQYALTITRDSQIEIPQIEYSEH